MKLLLIDDDVFLRDMYALKFKEEGHEVEVAEGAAEGLGKISRSLDFDVVLLDMIMPTITGVELIKKIRAEFPTFKAKCVVLSNQGQPEDIEEAKKAGAAGYIIKAEEVPSEVVKKVTAISKK